MGECTDDPDTRRMYTHAWLSIFLVIFTWSALLFVQARRTVERSVRRPSNIGCWEMLGSFSTRTISYTMITLHTGIKSVEFVLREAEVAYNYTAKNESDEASALFIKHLLFVLPLAFLFTTYSALLTFWFRIAKNVTSAYYTTLSLKSLFRAFTIANIGVYIGVIILSISIGLANESADEIRAVTNIFISFMYLVIVVGFLYFAIKLYLIIKTIPMLRTNFHVQLSSYRQTLVLFSWMAGITSFLLIIYSVILMIEAVSMLSNPTEDRADYPVNPCLLSAFRVGETVPPMILLYILQSFPMGGSQQGDAHRGASGDYGTLPEAPRQSF
eukprot:TRINITY_DN17300_c0_g1_i1.p1 TRINITY_DN17300_c0_g1~~TRINITY_DN17300_c0_g1_i1.p1  ORF type:complete len:328 (-),score=48.55 TRINITY_DN17300_c0_g1_i1:102-1085(-)